jgi:hypothetical protein
MIAFSTFGFCKTKTRNFQERTTNEKKNIRLFFSLCFLFQNKKKSIKRANKKKGRAGWSKQKKREGRKERLILLSCSLSLFSFLFLLWFLPFAFLFLSCILSVYLSYLPFFPFFCFFSSLVSEKEKRET